MVSTKIGEDRQAFSDRSLCQVIGYYQQFDAIGTDGKNNHIGRAKDKLGLVDSSLKSVFFFGCFVKFSVETISLSKLHVLLNRTVAVHEVG